MSLNLATPVPASVVKATLHARSHCIFTTNPWGIYHFPLFADRETPGLERSNNLPSVTQELGGGAVTHKQADNRCQNPQSNHRSAHTLLQMRRKEKRTEEKGCSYIRLKN